MHRTTYRIGNIRRKRLVPAIITAVLAIACSCSFSLFNEPAYADIDELQGAVNEKKSELDATIEKLEAAQELLSALQGQMDELLVQVDEEQAKLSSISEKLNVYASAYYKMDALDIMSMILQADTLSEVISTYDYFKHCQDNVARQSAEQREVVDALNAQIDEVSANKDEQETVVAEMEELKKSAQAQLDELRKELTEEQIKTYGGVMGTFDTGDTTGWRSGPASAYGGYGDASIADNQRTATGARVNESSMGVAIPMAWGNTRSYYGKRVEISYNGKSVIATVNDCGGMNGGQRHLDLQPGVFKSFGYDNCNAWGVRNVKYRFLD